MEGSAFLEAKRQEGITSEELEAVQESRLLNVWLLPSFGAQTSSQDAETDTDPEGYVFVPDGSGALLDLKQSPRVEALYEQMV